MGHRVQIKLSHTTNRSYGTQTAEYILFYQPDVPMERICMLVYVP